MQNKKCMGTLYVCTVTICYVKETVDMDARLGSATQSPQKPNKPWNSIADTKSAEADAKSSLKVVG